MRTVQLMRQELRTALFKAMAALFIVPLLLWGFTHHVLDKGDQAFLAQLDSELAQEPAARRDAISAAYRATPPSAVCGTGDPELAQYRAEFCEPFSDHWQFFWADRLAKFMVVTGVLLLVGVGVLGWLAFRDRTWQYRSLVLGWHTLVTSSALVVVVQSAIMVWLSFYLTAYFLHKYSIKLVALMGLCAAAAAVYAVAKIFERASGMGAVEGEAISEADAPVLWARVRTLAARLGTAAPDNIIAGIDDNFFVTESALLVQQQVVSGRTLFVSLPLLRVLDQSEADAILVHELAHFSAGDAENSALLGPKLMQFDRYLCHVRDAGLTLVAYLLLHLYRLVFELALKEDSRRREFVADRAAASEIGAAAVASSLVKVVAYSSYRAHVECELFSRDTRHREALGIASFVAQGLRPFAETDDFLTVIGSAAVPHPFDSHPTLDERMANVGSAVTGPDLRAILMRDVDRSWVAGIHTADAVEERLWQAYEDRFVRSHERELSWRAALDDEETRAMVETHFPPVVFKLKKDTTLTVTVDGMTLPGTGQFVAWERVVNMEYNDGFTWDIVKIWTPEKLFLHKKKTIRFNLHGVRPQRAAVRGAIFQYWQRSRVARGIVK